MPPNPRVHEGIREIDVNNAAAFWHHTNVVAHLDDEELETAVTEFIQEGNLGHLGPTFRAELSKAARVLKWQDATDSDEALRARVPELTDADLQTLKREGRWKDQPWGLFLAVLINSIAAVVQGWDQSGTNGANLFWTSSMGISIEHCLNMADPQRPADCTRRTLLLGFVNSAPYIMISLVACWLSDPLNHYLGRRLTIFIGAICSVIAPLASAATHSWPELMGTRFILGLGMGLKEVTVPILSAEIAPRQIRGALVMSWQICTAFGIMLGCAANLISLSITDDQNFVWRLQLGSAFIPATFLLVFVLFGPESPRWLVRKRRLEKAYRTLQRVRGRGNELLAVKELFYLNCVIGHQDEVFVGTKGFQRFVELFTKPRVRRAMVAASIVMISQQFCGINVLAFYSSTVFDTIVQTNGSSYQDARTALFFSLGVGVTNFIFAWPAFFSIDKYGRRPLLLVTVPLMFLFLFIAGLCTLIEDKKVSFGVVVAFLYLFVVVYSPGMGPIPFTYSAEVFPITHREIGMSWAVSMNNLFGAALSLSFPSIWQFFRPLGLGTLFFFAGLNIISFILIFLFVPETHLKTLEDLNAIFDRQTRAHAEHELCHVLPWALDRVTGRKASERPIFAD